MSNINWNYETVLNAAKHNIEFLKNAPNKYKNNKKFILELIKHDVFAVKFMSNKLKDDYDIILKAVSKNCYILEYASDRLKDNFEIALTLPETVIVKNDVGISFILSNTLSHFDSRGPPII